MNRYILHFKKEDMLNHFQNDKTVVNFTTFLLFEVPTSTYKCYRIWKDNDNNTAMLHSDIEYAVKHFKAKFFKI